jgi:hypothetical protein
MRAGIFVAIFWAISLVASASMADITFSGADGQPPVVVSDAQIRALPQQSFTTATPWTTVARYTGPTFTDVLRSAGLSGGTVILTAADDYKVEIDMADIVKHQPILAWQQDGQPLPLRDRGPYWLMFRFDDTPQLRNDTWYYRAIWQVVAISVRP